MAIETIEKQIGEATFAVTQLPARRALKLKAKIIKHFGAALSQLFITILDDNKYQKQILINREGGKEISQSEQLELDENLKRSVVKGIELLAANIDDKTFDEFVLEILQGTRRNGVEMTAPNIDQNFAGNLRTLYEVLFFVLEVNYADFFPQSNIGSQSDSNAVTEAINSVKTYTYK